MVKRVSIHPANQPKGRRVEASTIKKVGVIAAGTLLALGIGAGIEKQRSDADNYNEGLHNTTSHVLDLLSNQDSEPGIAIVDGKTVTTESLAKEKAEAAKTIESFFTDGHTVEVLDGQTPGEALLGYVSLGAYHSDDMLDTHNTTLDESEQAILAIAHGSHNGLPADISRRLYGEITEVKSAHDDGRYEESLGLQDKLQADVIQLANQTFAGSTSIEIPN